MAELTDIQDLNKSVQALQEFSRKPENLSIEKKIGRGSNGVVHRGTYQGQKVAVKVITDLLIDVEDEDQRTQEAKSIQQFLKEVNFLRQLEHKHIVKYLAAFYNSEQQEPMLVMECMSRTMKSYLKDHRKTLILSKQFNICLQIAEGVQFLHHQQPPLAHRDLTNTNVLVSEDGTFKISDLGQGKLKPDLNRRYFKTETPGSLAYMPPEVHGESPHYTESIDIFSLGVLMVEVATQQPPTVTLYGIGEKKELDRRESDLNLMGVHHPLRGLSVQCLEDNYKTRPSIDEVVDHLSNVIKRSQQHRMEGNEESADDDNMCDHPTHVVACRWELFECIKHYLQAARECVENRNTGKHLLTQAARDLDKKGQKKVAKERMAAITPSRSGSIVCDLAVEGSLLVAGVSARTGMPVNIKGDTIAAGGSITGIGTLFEDMVRNCKALEQAIQWTKENKEFCLDRLLSKHERFCKMLSSVSKDQKESEDACLRAALQGRFGGPAAQFTLESLKSAHAQVTLVVQQWKAATEIEAQELATGILAATTEPQESSKTQEDSNPASTSTEAGRTGAVSRGGAVGGVETTVGGAGSKLVRRTVAAEQGGEGVGLSAAFLAIDLELLIKTNRDINKNKKGRKIADTLKKIEEAIKEETEQLQPLASLRL